MHPVAQTLNQIQTELSAEYFEREDVIYSMCLALLAGEHHFILGPPGTAKSQMVRALVEAIDGASYFEVALSKTRPAEAVLGPLDIKEFRDNGNYFLKRTGFASAVDVCFFDEIGKMSPVLGHDLLALLNERVYHEVNGGRSVHQAPLHIAFTASNEMPMNESDDAAALWDRLLVRTHVDFIQERKTWAKMLTGTTEPITTKVPYLELKKAATTDVPAVTVSKEAINALMELRLKLEGENIRPSDRRWRASMKVLKASAFLDGRTEVDEGDLGALRFTLWETLEEIERISSMAQSAANPFVESIVVITKGLKEVRKGLRARENGEEMERLNYAREANAKLVEVRKALDDVLTSAGQRQVPGFCKAAAEHMAVQKYLFTSMFGHDDGTAQLAAEGRVGAGVGNQTR